MLRQLLDDGERFDAEYGGDLSNHLPMALVALNRLGAGDDRLAAFDRAYRRKKGLKSAPPAAAWPAGDAWTAYFGQRSAWPSYRGLFAEWLMREGGPAVLAQTLPILMPGCGAAAFHGLIRTSYAVQVGHAGELADGLAYWACRYLPLADAPRGRQQDPVLLLTDLAAAFTDHAPSSAGLIFERMHAAAAVPAFGRIVARLKVGDSTLATVARHAAGIYAGSGNFTALHLVTSAHALRVLLPLVGSPLDAVGVYWNAYAAGFIASAAQVGDAPEPLPWSTLVAAAVESDDDHLIKLVDSCREEERAYGGDDWQRAASRAVIDAQ